MLKTPKLVRIASGVLGIAALVAVGWYTYKAFDSGLSFGDLRLDWLIASFVLHMLVVAALPVMWIRVLAVVRSGEDRPAKLTDSRLLNAYGRSWMARYIPGRVWMLGGRVLYGRQAGISAKSIGSSTALEAGLSYSALGLLGAALLVGAYVHWSLAISLTVAAFGGTLILVRLVFTDSTPGADVSRVVKLVVRTRQWIVGDERPSTMTLAGLLLMFWLHAAAQLVFFIMVALSVSDFDSSEYMLLAGAWGVGASIGYLSIFSAGGLGVRDGVALAFVGPALTGPVGATVVAVSRIILVSADLAFVAAVEAMNFLRNRRAADSARSNGDIAATTGIAVEKGS